MCADVVAIPLGQRLMRDRPPFKLKAFAVLHNLVLFSLSLYMSLETLKQVGSLPLPHTWPYTDRVSS